MFTLNTSPERKLKLCVLPTCKGKRYDLVHKFPMNQERAQQWIDIIDLPELKNIPLDKVRKRFFVCSRHFRPQDYKNCESRSLNITAYPSLHLKVSEFDSNEQYSLNDDNNIDILSSQECEFRLHAVPAEMPEIYSNQVLKATAQTDSQNTVQLIVCSSAREIPLILKKKREREVVAVKSQTDQCKIARRNDNAKLKALPVAPTYQTLGQHFKREEAFTATLPDKQNATSSEMDGLMILTHESFESALKVCSFWLRDHCRCSICYGETSQRKTNINNIPLDVKATTLKTKNNFIYVTWSDGHESIYNVLELNEKLNLKPKPISPYYWSAADANNCAYASFSLNDYLCNDAAAKDVVASLIKYGMAFIKNVPANIQSTEIAVRRLFPIQKTLFGEMWSFSDNKAHNDTAYTNEELPAHNDNTYFSDAAGLQILHCVSRAGEGGENFFVDGFHVLNNLRKRNKEAYDYLSKVNITSEYIEDGYHFKHCAPVIMVDSLTGEPTQIRFNMNDRAFCTDLPQHEMFRFYRHYKELAAEIQSDSNEWRFKLEPGTLCIFDNWRVLHGRSSYTGRRQMVGCYVARSEFLSVARRYGIIS